MMVGAVGARVGMRVGDVGDCGRTHAWHSPGGLGTNEDARVAQPGGVRYQ
jgi:hypothetical protein